MPIGRIAGVLVLALLVAGVTQVGTATAGQAWAASSRNPFGITLVRFKPGTTPAQMQDAVTRAGGTVITDLSHVNAVAALPAAADFARRIRADARVVTAWEDRVFSRPRPDVAAADAGRATSSPALGGREVAGPPDPWHDLPAFLGESNPEGILQWDDNRMNVPAAWAVTRGNRTVRVAVIDTGVQGAHKELQANYNPRLSTNTIPCNELTRTYGNAIVKQFNLRDCSSQDTDGHGTWVASRIAGAANGFASNGVAPNVEIVGYKALATGFGGLSSWILAAMIDACLNRADIINLSLGGYADPNDPYQAQDYLLWVAVVNFCRARGTAIIAAAGNEHVRIHRVNMTVGGVPLLGVGRVDLGAEGYATVVPGDPLALSDLRGLLQVPAGVPGVIMVSATNNAIGAAGPDVPAAVRWPAAFTGARDQLAYYSNYGSRVDIAAPGGARKFNIPRHDGGPGDILYGGWGTLGALDPSGEICTDPALASLLAFACFKVTGAGFGWLQGTSMSSANAAGVAALVLAARPELRGNPDGLLARLKATARTTMTNYTGPNDPANFAPSYAGVPCTTGYCHLKFNSPISFADAYGAGMVDAGAAVAP